MSELASFPSKPKALADKQHRGRRLLPLVNELAAVLVVLALIGYALLGFSVFLAGRLGVLPIFNGNSTSTPTPSVATATVPNLSGDTFKQAQQAAQQAGFKLQLSAGSPTTGVVVGQNPQAGNPYPVGQYIEVTLGVEQADKGAWGSRGPATC